MKPPIQLRPIFLSRGQPPNRERSNYKKSRLLRILHNVSKRLIKIFLVNKIKSEEIFR